MCRVYRSKKGSYVRLCYRFGPRRGQKDYFDGDPPLSPSGHYVADKKKSLKRKSEEEA